MRAWVLTVSILLASIDVAADTGGWIRVPSPVDDPLHNGFFVDDAHGWIVSYGTGIVLGTSDAGRTWSVLARLDPLYYESLAFVDPLNGWLCGERATLLRTADGGRTWATRKVTEDDVAFYGIRFRDPRHAFLVGGNARERRGVVFESRDGGDTWTPRAEPPPPSLLEPIVFVDGMTGFIGGGHVALRTTDGGESWRAVDLGEGLTMRGLCFLDARNGWAVGHRGAVLRTDDGGVSWRRLPAFTGNRLRSVHFIDPRNGSIAGDADTEPGTLWRSADAGATWTRVEGDVPDIHRLLPGPGGVWAVGKRGTIMRHGADPRAGSTP